MAGSGVCIWLIVYITGDWMWYVVYDQWCIPISGGDFASAAGEMSCESWEPGGKQHSSVSAYYKEKRRKKAQCKEGKTAESQKGTHAMMHVQMVLQRDA